MTRRYRRPPPRMGFAKGLCSSGKRSYFTRDGAKDLVKRIKSEGDKAIRSYWCTECEHWHVGHIPAVVRRGEYTAGEIYGRPAS